MKCILNSQQRERLVRSLRAKRDREDRKERKSEGKYRRAKFHLPRSSFLSENHESSKLTVGRT